MGRAAIAALILALSTGRQTGASIDLAIADCGVSLGNSPRLTGLRLNAVDEDVIAVNGINLTLWNPGANREAAHRGLSLGLIGPKATTIDGLALGGLGTVVHDRLLGVGAAGFGLGASRLWGAGAAPFLLEAHESLIGVGLAGYRLQAPRRVWGIAASTWRTRAGNATGAIFGAGMATAHRMRGIQMGAITHARSLNGLAIGGAFAGTWDDSTDAQGNTRLPVDARSRGIVAAAGGAVADTLTGAIVGGLFGFARDLTGVVASPLAAAAGNVRGLVFGLVGAGADSVRGIAAGGLLAAAEDDLVGAALSAGYAGSEGHVRGLLGGGVAAYAKDQLDGVAVSLGATISEGRVRGIAVGGLLTAAEVQLDGVAASLGAIRSDGCIRGIALAGLATAVGDSITGVATGLGLVGAGDRVHGLALGGLTCLSPEVVGVSTGLFNGAMAVKFNLKEFLVVDKVNRRTRGLAIGLVNYTSQLHGVQLGLLNWAGNNPPWLRLLPIVNVHI